MRLSFIDNLRWTMILLVISMHAADTYSALGNWYFVDRVPLSMTELLFFAAWQMYLQSFFMGLLFFVAGYFVPASFDRKGPSAFVRDRVFRLGLPVIFYMFILGPITEYYAAHSWTSTLPTSFGNEWLKHIRDGEFLQENGPLWFCLALLIFSTVYALFGSGAKQLPVDGEPPRTLQLIGFVFIMAALTFMVRLAGSLTVLNMHLGDFPQYILLFSAGILAARRQWLPKLQFSSGTRWMALTLSIGFPAWLALIIIGGALKDGTLAYSGGWHWQSASVNLWEAFTCVGICFGLLVLFREYFNTQGRIAKCLSDNAFSVYVFHPPLLIVGARLLHGVLWQPILKFLLLTTIGVVLSFSLSALVFRRIPFLRSIL
ncbi:MAG: acyltransferase family protein [Steroidobacteraceae bacterium]